MRDIVERLRDWISPGETHRLNKEAADEIERLRAAIETALRGFRFRNEFREVIEDLEAALENKG